MKSCSKCGTHQPFDQFSTEPRKGKPRLSSWCLTCKRRDSTDRRAADPTAARLKEKIWRASVPADKKHNGQLKVKFGLTKDDFDKKSGEQNNVCAVCFKPETVIRAGKVKNMAVDHSHLTGQIRGLLCQRCNQALGLMKEDFDAILSLAKYVQHHNNVI